MSATAAIEDDDHDHDPASKEHALISTFDLFSIGIGPSSSHTVGPMRAGNIFVADVIDAGLLDKVAKIRISIYGSLALTGEGHMTPSALLLGLEGASVDSVDTAYVPQRFIDIKRSRILRLGTSSSHKDISFDYAKDFVWEWSRKLPTHSNGMRLAVFDKNGDPLATNDLFSIGGGFVVNDGLKINPFLRPANTASVGALSATTPQNIYHKEASRVDNIVPEAAINQHDPHTPYPFHNANSLLAQCKQHNLTIAQVMYENERGLGHADDEIFDRLFRLWDVMDGSIREGVQAPIDKVLPGSLQLRRRAPALYQKLTKGLYPETLHANNLAPLRGPQATASLPYPTASLADPASKVPSRSAQRRRRLPRLQGSPHHPIALVPARCTTFPAMDYLTVYAIAVNETNAAGGRVVTAPTNGAAGIIPAVLKYVVEFISDDPERDIPIFLLTAAAIASLYKRGATISAAEGGCMAEVGVACSMAAGAYAACMGAGPETIEQAAEIGIEHNLGLTCDPIGGLVQAPCIERNALGAIKAISSANLALNSVAGTQKVRLDDAIRAMRLTAKGMQEEFKETSLSGLATSVPFNIPVSVPDC